MSASESASADTLFEQDSESPPSIAESSDDSVVDIRAFTPSPPPKAMFLNVAQNSLYNNADDRTATYDDDDDSIHAQKLPATPATLRSSCEQSHCASTLSDDETSVGETDYNTAHRSLPARETAVPTSKQACASLLGGDRAVTTPDEISVFMMTWNSESVLIAETLQRSGHEPVSMLSERWYGCKQPDFLPALIEKYIFPPSESKTADGTAVRQGKHHLIVVALQESAKPGDYLLSNALPRELGERYTLLKRGRMMGIGRTTVNALKRDGALRMRGLRLAVFVRKDFASSVHYQAENEVLCTTKDQFTRGKGGYGIVVRIDNFGLVAFLNVHLPFVASTLIDGNHARLTSGVQQQNEAFCTILQKFLEKYALHHLFVLGDFNYRVMHLADITDAAGLCREMCASDEFRDKLYRENDELLFSIRTGHLPPFQEGVNNAGPQFMPTAKMQHQRAPNDTSTASYKFGKHNHRNPSWCDRILFLPGSLQRTPTIGQLLSHAQKHKGTTFRDASAQLDTLTTPLAECTSYERFESGETMTYSDHSAVCATYTLKRRV